MAGPVAAAVPESDPELDALLALDISELTVTSVSRRPQLLQDAAAAIYVLTAEDIQRMGATSIPEALRAVPGVEVAQIRSNEWSITARGFSGGFANKLLVMIDGRTIYSPIFSGTYWDDQSTLMEDIERIEVVRGPGGTLWGANAVNGVINVITKHSADTRDNLLVTGLGTEEQRLALRHGGDVTETSSYRVYTNFQKNDATHRVTGGENTDDWDRQRAGFRFDAAPTEVDSFQVTGDIYTGNNEQIAVLPSPTAPFSSSFYSQDDVAGANIVGRWSRELSKDSSLSLKGYFDIYSRNEPFANQKVTTADLDFQHQVHLTDSHHFIWGVGYRNIQTDIEGSFLITLQNNTGEYEVYSAFLQDEYEVVDDTLFFTLGSKFEHNYYTGVEAQPNARLAWKIDDRQTLWGSISRAVRVPSILESEILANFAVTPGAPPTVSSIFGSTDLQPEVVWAKEIGYRIQPRDDLSIDSTLFYNNYDNLITSETTGGTFPGPGYNILPSYVRNLGRGHSYGGELAVNYTVNQDWRLFGSYSYVNLGFETSVPGASLEAIEGRSPEHRFSIRSYYNVTDKFRWDNMLYYTGDITTSPARPIGDYWRYDTRLAYDVTPGMELSLVGRNLLEDTHSEFSDTPFAEIERSLLATMTLRF